MEKTSRDIILKSIDWWWCSVAKSCPTLCNRMVCSLPGSSVHRISQARILEWVAIFFSRGSSWRIESGGGFFTTEPPGKPKRFISVSRALLVLWFGTLFSPQFHVTAFFSSFRCQLKGHLFCLSLDIVF